MEVSQLDQVINTPFAFVDTSATRKIFTLKKRIRAVAGGTSASKTISILVWCIDYCQTKQARPKVASVISESFPHLQRGAILDFQNIMKDRGYWDDSRWNETKHTYTFETGNKLEFYSVDTLGKARGPRRDVLFLNECNVLSYKIVDQLIVRTREVVWLDWNPSEEFWFYTEMQPNRSDIDFITLTYKDNEALDHATIMEIESHKGDKNWWLVYGLGQLGVVEARIYKNWRIIEEIPHEARLIAYGLDFGYTNDPTAIIAIYYYNGGYIFDEIVYAKGLLNKAIADIFKTLPVAPIIADSAEPKSIDELRLYSLTVIPATKGKGSVSQGIQFVQQQSISVTTRSTHTIKEHRNYMFVTDKDGKVTNDPVDYNNHCMDATRYGMQIKMSSDKPAYKQPAWESPLPTEFSGGFESSVVDTFKPHAVEVVPIGGGKALRSVGDNMNDEQDVL